MDVLLVGDIFCSCSVKATFSDPVRMLDAVDKACGKHNNWNTAAPSRIPGASSQQRRTKRSNYHTSTCCGEVSICFLFYSAALSVALFLRASPERTHLTEQSSHCMFEHVTFCPRPELHGGARGRDLTGIGIQSLRRLALRQRLGGSGPVDFRRWHLTRYG